MARDSKVLRVTMDNVYEVGGGVGMLCVCVCLSVCLVRLLSVCA